MTESIILILLFGTFTFMMFIFVTVIFLVINRQRAIDHKLELERIRIQNQYELVCSRFEVQEQALNAISLELHDNIGQVLSGTRMQLLSLLKPLHHAGSPIAGGLKEATFRLGKSISDLRNLSHLLNGNQVEKIGLLEAIEKELDYVRSVYKLQCTLDFDPFTPDLQPGQNILLFRIIQESVLNSIKHAGASVLNIALHYKNDKLNLTISDNGKGFDPGKSSAGKGMGLHSINQRIKLMGGHMQILSNPCNGTKLLLTCKPDI